jgi:hypothetical protein
MSRRLDIGRNTFVFIAHRSLVRLLVAMCALELNRYLATGLSTYVVVAVLFVAGPKISCHDDRVALFARSIDEDPRQNR